MTERRTGSGVFHGWKMMGALSVVLFFGAGGFMPVLVGRCFGELEFSKIMGFLMGGFAVGIIIGIPVSGWIYDTTGSYELVLISCLVGLSLATLLATLIRPERHHPEFATA